MATARNFEIESENFNEIGLCSTPAVTKLHASRQRENFSALTTRLWVTIKALMRCDF
jgi:hypothetical protein